MNVKTKSTLILVGTLVIGMVLGGLIDRSILRTQFKHRVERMRNPLGFMQFFEGIIEPNEEQYDAIKELLEKRSQQLHEIGQNSRDEMKMVMDSLKMDIDPLLTAEQKARLERKIENMKHERPRHDKPPFLKPPWDRDEKPPMPPPPPPFPEEE